MIRTIVIDDEKRARETICSMLKLYCPNVEVVGEAENIVDAEKCILETSPDLIFLDVNMPGGSGFDLLKRFKTIPFKIIFITAYEEYALRAFKFSALDYILKPVSSDDLIASVNKAQGSIEKENINTRLESLFSNIGNIKTEVKKIVVKTSESIHVINVSDIVRCEASGNYTNFILNSGKKILVSNTLKDYDDMLNPYHFFRAHQSHLVNIEHVESYNKKDGGFLLMKDKSMVPVSVRKKDTLLELLGKI